MLPDFVDLFAVNGFIFYSIFTDVTDTCRQSVAQFRRYWQYTFRGMQK